MARQTITFVLDTKRDRDIICWLEGQENKSAAIREAIRAHLDHDDITLVDIYEAVQDLQRRNWTAVSEAEAGVVTISKEPPDVAAALDSLGL
jgi:hypothetical protein